MAEHNWADNEVLRATDVDNVLEHQVVHTQTSFGTAWLGKHVYRSDRDILYRYDGTDWVSYPMGELGTSPGIGTGDPTHSIVGTEVTVNGISVTFTGYTGEHYEWQASFQVQGLSGNDVFTNFVDLDGSHIDQERDTCIDGNFPDARLDVHQYARFTVGSNGSHTIRARIQRTAGSSAFGGAQVVTGGRGTVNHMGG